MCLRNALSYGQAVSEAGPPRTEEFMLLFLYQGGYTLGADIMSLTLEGARSLVYVQTMLRFFLAVPYSTWTGGTGILRYCTVCTLKRYLLMLSEFQIPLRTNSCFR